MIQEANSLNKIFLSYDLKRIEQLKTQGIVFGFGENRH